MPRRGRAQGEDGARAGAACGPTAVQWLTGAAAMAAIAAALAWAPRLALSGLHRGLLVVFGLGVLWRLAALAARPRATPAPDLPDAELPRYTVIAPLYQEGAVAAQLIANLSRLDYPADRLQVLVALEADDHATRAAVQAAGPPPFVQVVLAPAAGPRTKPRACNAALRRATGELVVIYDAEDAPHPCQLREAAARFAAGPARLACLQAPLRIVLGRRRGLVQRQFALEYAALFEVMLPAYARWGLPFPLGGTSNHFRRAALEAVGGWDDYNVTEDADVGLRLAAQGWRLGVLSRPTFETAPDFEAWLPQRARWVKGYMQTWGVHMRTPFAGGWRRFAALQLMLGYAILSAVMHGPLALGVAASVIVAGAYLPGRAHLPDIGPADLALCLAGWWTALAAMAVGARRAGGRLHTIDALFALAYWPMQSLAAAFAVQQLIRRPFHWDKTSHPAAASNAGATPAVAVATASARLQLGRRLQG